MSFMVDLLDVDEQSKDLADGKEIKFTIKLCLELAQLYDPIRRFYWAYIATNIENKYNFEPNEEFKIILGGNTNNGK